MRQKLFSFILFVGILLPNTAFSWGVTGHRIITEIAYRMLNRKARKQVDKLLGTKGIVYYSSWADEIKSDTIYPQSYGWHFQNLDAGLSNDDLEQLYNNKLQNGEHVIYVLDSMTVLLRNEPENVDALKFVVHLAGDIFQPMHMGHSADRGGNAVRMTWFGRKTNLHAVWDDCLIEHSRMTFTEYSDFLVNRYGSREKELMALSELECLCRTYDAVCKVYDYQVALGENLEKKYEYKYYYDMRSVLELQLYTAAVQLAKRLNEVYK
ncbi:MAG: S1/P1 nuclease [Paludibacteraceae bacterium]|nr:S1/P1 nuclease [Paludibacteraceae bacterium]